VSARARVPRLPPSSSTRPSSRSAPLSTHPSSRGMPLHSTLTLFLNLTTTFNRSSTLMDRAENLHHGVRDNIRVELRTCYTCWEVPPALPRTRGHLPKQGSQKRRLGQVLLVASRMTCLQRMLWNALTYSLSAMKSSKGSGPSPLALDREKTIPSFASASGVRDPLPCDNFRGCQTLPFSPCTAFCHSADLRICRHRS